MEVQAGAHAPHETLGWPECMGDLRGDVRARWVLREDPFEPLSRRGPRVVVQD